MSDVEGNRRLEEIAATVADGGHVDWRRALVENPRLTAPLTGLRKLAELRSAFGHLAGPSETVSEADHEDTVPVSRLWGHLEVRELLGSGSFGSVYRVFDPVLRREVALKLFRSEMAHADSGSLMDEARALARVRHRNVLAVHGADLHDGRMGLWTDLVAGQTLESQIEAGPLTRQRQMEVALDLVAALEAVHGAGLVHGDVKAANVMIEGQGADAGRAVLMDFGAARTRDHAGERVGSPLSMAPELFAGEPASAAADVYALGVILYRMASGRYPVSATTLEELADLHRTRRARLSFEARAWRRTPLELRRVIEALLDPSPEGRPTAAQAGQRLRHVQSAPQRRRRRLAVAVIVTSLLAGTIASSIAYLRARRSQAVALAAREEAEAVNEFLEDVLSSPRSSVGGRQVTVTELLERSESLVEDRFADQPSARGRALLMLGETQAQLGSWDEGETLLRRATTMLHQARGAEDPLTLRADLALARTLRSRAEHSPKEQAEPARQDARALLVDVLAHADRALPVAHPLAVSVRTELAAVARSQQDIPEAERWARAALARSEGAPWAETQERILAQVELSAVLTAQGKFAEAETLLRPTVDWFEDVYGARHSSTLASRQRLAIALIQQGKEVEAEPILREDVATTREWLGPDDEITLEAVAALSNNLHSQRRTAEALELSREVSDMARRIYGEDDPNTLMFLGNQANRLMELEEWDQAEAIYRNVIEGLAAAVGADHRWTLVTKANLAELLLDTKRPREARLLADAAAEGLAKLYPPEHLYVIFASCLSAGAQATSDDAIGGTARLAELVRRATASLGPEHPQTLDARIYLARARGASGQWSEAEAILSDVADVRKRTLGDDHPDAVAVERELAELRSRQKQTDTVRSLATPRIRATTGGDIDARAWAPSAQRGPVHPRPVRDLAREVEQPLLVDVHPLAAEGTSSPPRSRARRARLRETIIRAALAEDDSSSRAISG